MRSDGDRRHEAHKFADDAVRAREDEEGYGRLRTAVFWAGLGPLAIGAIQILKLTPPKLAVHGILATIPLAILFLIVNYIRLPGRIKTSGQTLMMVLMTLVGAGATFGLFLAFSLGRFLKTS